MASAQVRDAINAALVPLADPWLVYDLSDYESLEEVLTDISSNVVLVQYVASDDLMQTIGGEGNQGWEESGTAVVHLILPTGFASDPAVTKGDEIRVGMRGRRLTSEVVIESCSPFVDFGGGGFGVNGAVHGWAANMFFTRSTCG